MDFEKMLKRVDLNYSKNYIMCGNPCFEEQKHGRFEEEFEKYFNMLKKANENFEK